MFVQHEKVFRNWGRGSSSMFEAGSECLHGDVSIRGAKGLKSDEMRSNVQALTNDSNFNNMKTFGFYLPNAPTAVTNNSFHREKLI